MKTIKIKHLLTLFLITFYSYSHAKNLDLKNDFSTNALLKANVNLSYFQNRAVADLGITSIPSTMRLGTSSARGRVAYEVLPSDATDKTVRITSSNPNVATVNQNGVIIARSVGSTVIFVTTNDGGLEVRSTIRVLAASVTTVRRAVADLGIIYIPSTMTLGTSSARGRVTYEVLPNDATDKTVRIRSSNRNVATVNQNGVIVAKSVGSTEISITTNDGGLEVRSTIRVLAGGSNGGGSTCSAPKWKSGVSYKQKDIVSLNGKRWRWKPKKAGNCRPGNCTKWKDLGNCTSRNSSNSKDAVEFISANNNNLITVSVYPNPSKIGSDLNISIPEIKDFVNISISDLNGRVVFNEKFSTNKVVLKTSTFSKGLYLMRIGNANQFVTRKLLLN